jgi:hypothetical protein
MVSLFIPYMMGFLATPTEMQHAGSAHIVAKCSAIPYLQFPCNPAPYQLNCATFSQFQKEPMAVPDQFGTDLVILESFNHCVSVWQNTDTPIFIAPIYILRCRCLSSIYFCLESYGVLSKSQVVYPRLALKCPLKLWYKQSTTSYQSCDACSYQCMFWFNGPLEAKHMI